MPDWRHPHLYRPQRVAGFSHMDLMFLHPWLVFIAATLALAASALGYRTRRAAPLLLLLGAAAFFTAGARPQLGSRPPDVRHALVLDVSASMRARPLDIEGLLGGGLPAGHSFVHFELSDALREPGSPSGAGTDYTRLKDLVADARITGEVVLVTDGRGRIDHLYDALHPHRLILLRAPVPAAPDASVLSLQAPGYAPEGAAVRLRGVIRSDQDADVPWRLLRDTTELASGVASLRAEVPAEISLSHVVSGSGVTRFRLVLDLESDREGENDEAVAAVQLGGRLRVEYCTEPGITPGQDGLLQQLRADRRLEVRVRGTMPDATELESTGLLVLNNFSLQQAGLSREQTQGPADWVYAGGSLLMLGTDGAFGPGGYRGSPLEAVMPVRFRPDDTPPRRTLLLLDVSDSMNQQLPGGGTKMARLQEAAARVLETLGPGDLAAVVGFREGIRGDGRFLPPGDAGLAEAIALLKAQGSTHIGSSLREAVELLPEGEGARILMITDGEDVENAGEAAFSDIAARLLQRNARLDLVLTGGEELPWARQLKREAPQQVQAWSLQRGNFEDLIELLDRALADADRDWVMQGEFQVPGASATLPRLVRTAPRAEPGVELLLQAGQGPDRWPLLASRRLVGRTVCLCTDSWGDAALSGFWQDEMFRARLFDVLEFLLAGALRPNLVLNPLAEGAELVWTGSGEPPAEDLRTDAGMTASLDAPGRWLLAEWPAGEHLGVFAGERLLQRIPIGRPVPLELRATGDDEVFFAAAQQGGIRVFGSLAAWQPRRAADSGLEPTDLTWLPALLATLLLLAGFALRKR